MKKTINVTRSSMPPFEEYCAEIRELWDSHWLTNMGIKHNELERKLEEYLGVPHVSLYTNGHLALENILAALDLPKGGEVITTPFTFASTTHAIVRNGLTPVFCDVTESDYTLDPDKLERLITSKTVAVLPVHVYGNICNDRRISEIAERHGLKVVYDAAHAFGVKYRGEGVANMGAASMFSFHATKVFNTIEGGAVCFKDEKLIQRLKDMKNFGIRGPESCAYVGGNAKMSEFQAAMGLCNLRHLPEELEKRRRVHERYCSRLNGIDGIKLCAPQPDVTPNYAYYPVFFCGNGFERDRVYQALIEQGVTARKYFYPLTSDFECYRGTVPPSEETTPVAKYLSERVLTLPMYADLDPDDIDMICDAILASRK